MVEKSIPVSSVSKLSNERVVGSCERDELVMVISYEYFFTGEI